MAKLEKDEIIGLLIVVIVIMSAIIYAFYKSANSNEYYPCTKEYITQNGEKECDEYNNTQDQYETEQINDSVYRQTH